MPTNRTISAQLAIIKIAIDLFGEELRQKAKEMNVRDRWLRNVAKYFEALHEEEIADLKLSTSSKNDGPLDYDQVLAEVLEIQRAEKESDNKEIEDHPEDGEA